MNRTHDQAGGDVMDRPLRRPFHLRSAGSFRLVCALAARHMKR
jgi:hypothetical protein